MEPNQPPKPPEPQTGQELPRVAVVTTDLREQPTEPVAKPTGNPYQNLVAKLKGGSWSSVTRRANRTGIIVGIIFLILVAIGAAYWTYRSVTRQPLFGKTTSVEDDLKKLSPDTGEQSTIGTDGQTLTIGSSTFFKKNVSVGGNLEVAGNATVLGKINFPDLNVAGLATLNGADINTSLKVTGPATFSGNVTAAGQLSAGTLNVSGNASVGGSLTTGNINSRSLTAQGILTFIGHLVTGGSTPSVSPGASLGVAGTASISGNDTAGTVVFNAGAGASAGTLGTVTFRSAYGATPHVVITPTSAGAGNLTWYVSRTSTGFSVLTNTAPAPGGYSFDYFIAQ